MAYVFYNNSLYGNALILGYGSGTSNDNYCLYARIYNGSWGSINISNLPNTIEQLVHRQIIGDIDLNNQHGTGANPIKLLTYGGAGDGLKHTPYGTSKQSALIVVMKGTYEYQLYITPDTIWYRMAYNFEYDQGIGKWMQLNYNWNDHPYPELYYNMNRYIAPNIDLKGGDGFAYTEPYYRLKLPSTIDPSSTENFWSMISIEFLYRYAYTPGGAFNILKGFLYLHIVKYSDSQTATIDASDLTLIGRLLGNFHLYTYIEGTDVYVYITRQVYSMFLIQNMHVGDNGRDIDKSILSSLVYIDALPSGATELKPYMATFTQVQ